jgi:hypothetical protein
MPVDLGSQPSGTVGPTPLSVADLRLIDRTLLVEIETRAPGGPTHRTIIWAVVEDGVVYVRSHRGATARWYREAIADPNVVLHVEDRSLALLAVRAPDPNSVRACNVGLERVYVGSPDLPSMLVPEIFDCTLRLEPR